MMRVIISGGGTGGHIFPAVAIADAVVRAMPAANILFVGAKGRMEMERVPSAGYKIIGLDIAGIQRKLSFKNLLLPFKIIKSLLQARSIIKDFKPHVAVGVGGYASGPLLQVCGWMGIPYVIQEQNSFAGITNKILAKKADKVFVAYEGMEKFFSKDKIIVSGNPVRAGIIENNLTTEQARLKFGLDANKKTILIFGGSLGANTLNKAVTNSLNLIKANDNIQIVWQAGRNYFEECSKNEVASLPNIKLLPFIEDMAVAYKAADVVISRAGALSISELQLIGKPSILVPSPNVAEDHQTHNAMALVNNGAALMVKDADAINELISKAYELILNEEKQKVLSQNLLKMGKHDAAGLIASHLINMVKS